jgi:hypothetical protein
VGDAQGLCQLLERYDRRVAAPALEIADVLLTEARALGKLLLRQALREPDPLGVPSHQPPHIHAEGLGRRCRYGLSTIVCVQADLNLGSAILESLHHAQLASAPSDSDQLTAYDRVHLVTYLFRLLCFARFDDVDCGAASRAFDA